MGIGEIQKKLIEAPPYLYTYIQGCPDRNWDKFDQLSWSSENTWPTVIYCLFCPNRLNLDKLVNLLGQFGQILGKFGHFLLKLWILIAKMLKVPTIFDQLTSDFWPTRARFPKVYIYIYIYIYIWKEEYSYKYW